MRDHYRRLAEMYHGAPVNETTNPRLVVEEGTAEVSMTVDESMHHAAGSVHGATLFKLLDDAAFFAANSLVEDRFTVTANFSLHLLEPVQVGRLVAVGDVVHEGENSILAEARVRDGDGGKIAHGTGTFVPSGPPLKEVDAYADAEP